VAVIFTSFLAPLERLLSQRVPATDMLQEWYDSKRAKISMPLDGVGSLLTFLSCLCWEMLVRMTSGSLQRRLLGGGLRGARDRLLKLGRMRTTRSDNESHDVPARSGLAL